MSWTDTAINDLSIIVDYIALDDPGAAIAVLDRIEHRADALTSNPARGRVVPELQAVDVAQYRELIEEHWRIIYRIAGASVHVLAVLDSRRELQSLLLERLVRG